MNKLIKSALVVTAFSLSFGAAAAPKTDANYLAECKNSVRAQFDSVTKIDTASINSRRNLFKAKLRVTADGQRSMVACEIRGDQPVALECVKGDACKVSTIAAS